MKTKKKKVGKQRTDIKHTHGKKLKFLNPGSGSRFHNKIHTITLQNFGYGHDSVRQFGQLWDQIVSFAPKTKDKTKCLIFYEKNHFFLIIDNLLIGWARF